MMREGDDCDGGSPLENIVLTTSPCFPGKLAGDAEQPPTAMPCESADQSRRGAGIWLKTLRLDRGLSQRQMAARVGIECYSLISQIEAGRGSVPLNKCVPWANALDVEPREFVLQLLRWYHPEAYGALVSTSIQAADV